MTYAKFAAHYYETDVSEELVAAIFTHQPITRAIVRGLNPSISLENIADELYGEIQYPRSTGR